MGINIALTIGAIVFVLITVAWSVLVRRLSKTRIRFIGILVSFIIAIAGTFIVKSVFLNEMNITNDILPWLSDKMSSDIVGLLENSPTLCDVVLGCVSAIAAPLVFLIFFLVASFLSWIVYLLITLIGGAAMKEHDRQAPFAPGRAAILAVAQALIVLFVILVPVIAYTEVAPILTDEIKNAEMLDGEAEEVVDLVVEDYVKPLNSSAVVSTFRALGGGALTESFTSFEVNGETAYLKNEVGAVASIACDVMKLTQCELQNYGETEALVIISIADSFKDSEMLPAIAGELIYNATDAWLQGEDFIAIPADTIYFDDSGMFDDFMTTLLNVLHDDAKNVDALCNDLSTVADVMAILIRGEVFANLEDQEALVTMLSEGGVVKNLVTSLGNNASMKVLIPEVTNIGVRAIGTTLGIKDDAGVAYNEFLDTISTELNAIKDKSSSEQVEVMSSTLSKALNNAGMVVDSEVLDCYSVSMIQGLVNDANGAEVTPESVQAFFAIYAWSTQNYEQEVTTQSHSANSTTALAGKSGNGFEVLQALLIGTIYEGKTEEELLSSSAAVLARVTVKLTHLVADEDLDEDDENSFKSQASKIITEEFSTILDVETQSDLVEVIAKVTVVEPLSESTVNATAGLQNVETMKETTVLVTMDKLLVDTKTAADKINADNIEKEANAINNIFATANTLMKETGDSANTDITAVAGSVGSILDSLSETESFGKEQTSSLFTAVLQSETVRESANLDIGTATQLGQKGSQGDAKYEDTFNTVSNTVTVMGALGADGEPLEDEEIVKLIQGINPQTAGMIEVYVTRKTLTNIYGIQDNISKTAAPLISNLFGYMADAEMDDAQYAKEAKAINNILTVTMAARDNASDSEHNKCLFGDNGILNSADETVEILMSSKALAHSLRETLIKKDGSILNDPFELSSMIEQNEETDEAKDIEDAIYNYYHREGDRTAAEKAEEKLTLELIGALFGISIADMDDAMNG